MNGQPKETRVLDKKHSITLNMGPQHPSTHGVLHITVDIRGEMVTGANAIIGYIHRGIEKLAENRPYTQSIPLMDRLDYVTWFPTEHAYCLAVEELGGIEVPPRANYLRVIFDELGRMASHLIWLGTYGLDLGAFTPFMYCFREREDLLDIFEMGCGGRFHPNYYRFGGVRGDLFPELEEAIRAFCAKFPAKVDEYEQLMTGNEIFRHRTIGINALTAGEALELGLTGPLLRATGLASDIRKTAPYAAYKHLTFKVPVGEKGDLFDRYKVRVQEMRESCSLVIQALDKLPRGEIMGKAPKNLKLPEGETYKLVESSRGQLGVYLVSDGGPNPYRLHIKSPCFVNVSAVNEILTGWKVADAVAIIGSLDIILGEIDR